MTLQSKRRDFLKGMSLLPLASAVGCATGRSGDGLSGPSGPATSLEAGLGRRNERFKELNYDLVVVGGGMTGICAAIAAARHGAKTALIHERPVLGGNASSEIRVHVCGANANMKKPDLTEGGILHELMLENKRVNDSFNYSIWDAVLFHAVKREPNLSLFLNTTMVEAHSKDGVVQNIECYQMTTETKFLLSATFFADCTGNGTLCAFSGAAFRMGRDAKADFQEPHAPEIATNERMGNTLLFKAIDRGSPVPFIPPTDIIHFTEDQLKYRKHCSSIPKDLAESVSPEELERLYGGFAPDYGYWWVEIPGNGGNIIPEYEDIRDQLVRSIYGVWDHIKNGGDHGAENYELAWVGMLPGMRESRRVECDYMLTENDILKSRNFEDKVAYGGWPIDDNRFGLFAFDAVPAVTYALADSYDIPYRSYCVKDFRNLFVGGRCMGASRLAMASTRVMGTCAIGGQAIGTAAAWLCSHSKTDMRQIGIAELQQILLRDDCYLPGVRNQDPLDLARFAEISVSSEEAGFPVANLGNGISRALGNASNQWRSKTDDPMPQWIRFDFRKPATVSKIQVTFDSNFHVEKKMTMSSRRQKQQVPGVPKELVSDFEIVLYDHGQAKARKHVTGNYQRVSRIALPPTLCDAFQINVLSTNGDKVARVFEVRAYE